MTSTDSENRVAPATAARTGNGLGAAVRLDSVRKLYGDVCAVDDVSLEIVSGQFVTLLGPSGSGKTTVLRIIAGFVEASGGRVLVDGTDVSGVPVHKRRMGMVFQNYALFPHLNVYKNVVFPLARQRFPRAERQAMVDAALESVRLNGYQKRLPSELSGGQQQRVALARAIVAKPRLLLMDEPLGALDRRLRESLQVEIRKLSHELGLTVVNVTHDQEEALTMSDRIALLEDGRLVQFGAPEELYARPNSELAAKFLGESNRFSGRVRDDGGTLVLERNDGRIVVPRARGCEVAAGQDVIVVVRPILVRVRPDGTAAAPGESVVSGRVTADIFAGDLRKVLVSGVDGAELVVRMDANEAFDVAVGDGVQLAWDAEAAVTVRVTSTKDDRERETQDGVQ